ncbi:MAG TPA: hypothetical protein VKY22_01165 [Bradyrhizobium sp.]|jgi:hypothetical protein|nr:hypothetical protein [Bradyrhizobium sp.]
MPAFSFEKISPPVRPSPAAAVEQKQRSRIIQFLDRFTEQRTRRALGKDHAKIADPQKSSE